MCKIRDVLVFLIMLTTYMNIDTLKQLFSNSFVVQYIIYSDAEQILIQIESYKYIKDIIAKILLHTELFEGIEC